MEPGTGPIRGTPGVSLSPRRGRRSPRHYERLALLIAVVAITLVLVGLAVNVLSLGDCAGHACNMWNDGVYR